MGSVFKETRVPFPAYPDVPSGSTRRKKRVTFRQSDLSAGASKETKKAKEAEENQEANGENTRAELILKWLGDWAGPLPAIFRRPPAPKLLQSPSKNKENSGTAKKAKGKVPLKGL